MDILKRRHIIYFVIMALMAPQLVSALPRDPDLFSPDNPQGDLVDTVDVFASSETAALTKPLMHGRQYDLVVEGIFNPNLTGRKADAGFYSDDNFSTASGCKQNGTGLIVSAPNEVNYGGPGSGLICDRFGHKYSISHKPSVDSSVSLKIADPDGDRTNNSGKLTVRVYLQRYVTWTLQLSQPLGLVDQEEVVVDATPYSPYKETPPIIVRIPPIPNLLTLSVQIKSTNPNPGDPNSECPRNLSLVLWVNETPNEMPIIECIPREADELNRVTATVGPYGHPGGDQQLFPSFPLPLRQAVAIPPELRQGSKIVVRFSWKADVSKLVRLASTTGGNEVWSPFSVKDDALWFATNLDSVGGSIAIVPYRPDGTPFSSVRRDYPGLGQIIEAMFANRVVGK